jgi:acyl-CoA thioester hydrolase
MPVTDLHIQYKKPARYDELLLIETRIQTMPQSRIVFHYSMYNEAMELLNTAETELVFIRSSNMKPMRVPSIIIEALSKFFNLSDLSQSN